VQFRTGTETLAGRWTGRVEHVVSGQAIHFDSLEELLRFVGQVFVTVWAQRCAES
jgi:hypothetical protein